MCNYNRDRAGDSVYNKRAQFKNDPLSDIDLADQLTSSHSAISSSEFCSTTNKPFDFPRDLLLFIYKYSYTSNLSRTVKKRAIMRPPQ